MAVELPWQNESEEGGKTKSDHHLGWNGTEWNDGQDPIELRVRVAARKAINNIESYRFRYVKISKGIWLKNRMPVSKPSESSDYHRRVPCRK